MRIVLVGPEPEASSGLQLLLRETGHDIHLARDIEDATRLVTRMETALVLIAEPEQRHATRTLAVALRAAGYTGRIISTERLGKAEDTVPANGNQ